MLLTLNAIIRPALPMRFVFALLLVMTFPFTTEAGDGGRLLSVGQPLEFFNAAGEFQYFVPGVPVGPRTPEPGLIIGFIDSGTTSSHPQLSGLVIEEKSFVDGPVRDEIGHGTWAMLVTFTAAPEKRFGFYSAKVTRTGADLRAANVTAAFQWLVSKGVRIVNISLGFDRLTPDVEKMCRAIAAEKTVLVSAAAGNEGPDVKVYPASCTADNVLAVGEVSGGRPTATSGVGKVYAEPPAFLAQWAFINDQALVEIRAGHREAAIALYQKSIAIKENPTAFHQLALIYSQDGKLALARTMAERALALAPDNAMLNQTLGTVLYRLHDAAAAIPLFEHAIQIDPTNRPALLNLAHACIATKNFTRAAQVLDMAAARDFAEQNKDGKVDELRAWLRRETTAPK